MSCSTCWPSESGSERKAVDKEGRMKLERRAFLGAAAALTAIMGREAIYQRRMVMWKGLGVNV